MALLNAVGVRDQEVIRGVKEDKEKMKFHLACNRFVFPSSHHHPRLSHFCWTVANGNRVFDYAHKQEIKKVKDDGTWGAAQLETIVHPNEYFKRSYLLKNLGKSQVEGEVKGEESEDVKMED